MFDQSFPPANAFLQFLMGIDYKKHLNNLITLILTLAAVAYVLGETFGKWYHNGGNKTILEIIAKVGNFLSVCYTWVRSQNYPNLNDLIGKIAKTYKNWQVLVTV